MTACRLLVAVLATLATTLAATETEHVEFHVLPAPGPVTIDGAFADWDLSGSLFICSDVETYRAEYASWQAAMYDADNLYVLTRWLDATPLNNAGSVGSDMGFQGDCLQVRAVVRSGGSADGDADDAATKQRTSHLDCWRGRDGRDVVSIQYGKRFDEGAVADALTQGAKQAFHVDADGKGYVQEIAIPWKLLTVDGVAPKAGDSFVMTFEPNFGTTARLRISTKDLFRAGRTPDRVFTFASSSVWGRALLEPTGRLAPAPVRLADGRTFPVTLVDGVPAIEWTGLYRQEAMDGFAPIALKQPDDGFVSLVIRDGEGRVVRHLLNASFLTKGEHAIAWDGLTTPSDRRPGEPVAAGTYTWEAIAHHGLGLELVGWACNAGRAPFDSPGGNWGGDQGDPIAVDADDERVFLGWSGAEAGQSVVCVDGAGGVRWRHKRGGFGGAQLLAVDRGVVFVYDAGQGNTLYRLDAAKGDYVNWQGAGQATLEVGPVLAPDTPAAVKDAPMLSGMAAVGGRLLLAYGSRSAPSRREQASGDRLYVLDAATGAVLKRVQVPAVNDLKRGADGAVYAVLGDSQVAAVDPETGALRIVVAGLTGARAVAADRDGNVFVAVAEPEQRVRVFDRAGKPLRAIGRVGGRPAVGPWARDGLREPQGLVVDPRGKLWVMECDGRPRRISTWDAATGAFAAEFFGPTEYGAGGGAICPTDPLTMVGQGCEWKLSADTGRAECVAVISRDRWASARFATGKDGRTYLAVGGGWAPHFPVQIFERLGPAAWKLRTVISTGGPRDVTVWADRNDDQQRQPDEERRFDVDLGGAWIDGWYLYANQALAFGGTNRLIAPSGWTACGAPEYDLDHAPLLPAPADLAQRGGMGAQRGLVTEDGGHVLWNDHYGQEHSDLVCYDVRSGKQAWAYPSNYTGVHGGHLAPPTKVGLIRAAYDIVGTFPMPAPLGDVFVIGTDKGEWHLLSSSGFYIGRLFEGDPMRIRWPDQVAPGANLTSVPPGMGAEDFGGSVIRLPDGSVRVQHGKTAFIQSRVTGLDTVRAVGAGTVVIAPDDVAKARALRERKLAGPAAAPRAATIARRTVTATGDPAADFVSAPLAFGPEGSAIEAWLAHDDAKLYVAWRVQDRTPWINGATASENLYACGDTVDLQLGTDPAADAARGDAGAGDLRLSIGRLRGTDTAVIYRKVSATRAPKTFFSGTSPQGYAMDEVATLRDVTVATRADGDHYIVEAAIPLATLGLVPRPGLVVHGDVGATFGDPTGTDTTLRAYWSNQATGLVADEVEELRMQPARWGTLTCE